MDGCMHVSRLFRREFQGKLYVQVQILPNKTQTTFNFTIKNTRSWTLSIGTCARLQSHWLPIAPKPPVVRPCKVFASNVCVIFNYFYFRHTERTTYFICWKCYNSPNLCDTFTLLEQWPIRSITTTVVFGPTQGYNFLTSFLRYG